MHFQFKAQFDENSTVDAQISLEPEEYKANLDGQLQLVDKMGDAISFVVNNPQTISKAIEVIVDGFKKAIENQSHECNCDCINKTNKTEEKNA